MPSYYNKVAVAQPIATNFLNVQPSLFSSPKFALDIAKPNPLAMIPVMFEKLLSKLHAKDAAPLPDTDARQALGALLVRIAKSDDHYAFEEISQIDRILTKRYGLSVVAAAKLRHDCEVLETHAPDTEAFAVSIKEKVPYAERSAIVESLWHVVMADGVERPEEDRILDQTATILGVDTSDLKRTPPLR